MIAVPFHPDSFAREMKPKISGANLSLEYANIESSLYKIATEVPATVSQAVYDHLMEEFQEGNPPEPYRTAIDFLQRAMLHFTLYEHLIFIITRISNDGVTVKKNEDETTAYKYQTDELNNKLISTAWFWMNRLIQCLNEHSSDFPEWTDSDEKKEYDSLPVSLTDFNKWVGVTTTGGEYFMLAAGWIIREVWNDCVLARFKEPQKTDDITRAVCYEVMGRACGILAYSCLPEPIRKDIDNEMGKNHREKADVFIREHVAQKFIAKASVYWSKVDLDMDREQAAMLRKTTQQPIVGGDYSKENDKFFYL